MMGEIVGLWGFNLKNIQRRAKIKGRVNLYQYKKAETQKILLIESFMYACLNKSIVGSKIQKYEYSLVLYNQFIWYITMKKIGVYSPSKDSSQLSNSFLKDPNSDFLLILNQKIYPLHRTVLKESLYLRPFIESKTKVHVLNTDFDIGLFQQILEYLYGKCFTFERAASVQKILQIAIFLGIQSLQNILLEDMKYNHEDYGIFSVLQISRKFGFKDIYNICLQDLINFQFQQIIINKFDLFYCQKNILEHVLQEHYLLKKSGLIKGLRRHDICQVVKEYCKMNNVQINVDFSNSEKQNAGQAIKCDSPEQYKTEYKSTYSKSISNFTNPSCPTVSTIALYKNKSTEDSNLDTNIEPSHGKQATMLYKVNNKMMQKNKKFESEICELKNHIKGNSGLSSTMDDIEDLQERCSELKQLGEKQNKKLQNLKQSILKMSIQFKKNGQNMQEKLQKGEFKKPRTKSDSAIQKLLALRF